MTVTLNDLYTEFEYIWTHMNIPCMARKNIIKKFTEVIENFQNVLKCPKARRCGERFTQQIDLIRQSLENGFDIITSDSTRVKELEDIYGVDFGDEEQDLHKDNCILNESGVCPRIRWCGGIDFKWQKKANKKKQKNGEAETSGKEKGRNSEATTV